MNVKIEDGFHGALGFFGLLAFPNEKDAKRAKKFSEGLFYVWASKKAYQLRKEIRSKDDSLQIKDLKRQLKKITPILKGKKADRVQANVDVGMKRILRGNMLMIHLMERDPDVHKDDRQGCTRFYLAAPSKAVSDHNFMCRVRKVFELEEVGKREGYEANFHKTVSPYLPAMALHAAFASVNTRLKAPLCVEGLLRAAMEQDDGPLWYPHIPLGSSHSQRLELLSQAVHWLQVVASGAESIAEPWRRRTENRRSRKGVEQITINIIGRE